jgi:hypothetical protein
MQSKGDYILVNTFEELEGKDAVTALSLNDCPAVAVGPLFLPNFLEGRTSGCSLWEEEEENCLTWLDMQQPGSVIYVSFGSIAVKSEQQLEQLALGLEGSGQPFLWVLRLDIAEGQAAILPEGFEERTKERALFVRWAPQPKVLAHVSVGLFLTLSGWNSTLEAMSMGVPVVGFLWVLRLDIAEGQAAILPEGFEERTKERALFVKWAPQPKVLAHVSVGLFLTHSGWNSTLEAMSMGVPVVGFPDIFDQFLNCRFGKEVWKIGLAFEDVEIDQNKVVMKEEVEEVMRTMIRTPEGKKLRDNVLRLKESATKAVLPGGSSFLNLNSFVKDMTMDKGVQSKNETM